MSVVIGKETETGSPVQIDLPTLIDTRLLIQANSGGGKSWILRKLLEETHGQVQQIVLDLEGEFATLREKFDYLLVGKEGDIPIQLRIADLLPRRLLELNVSAIIDLYELKHHERILFVKRFLDAMINAPKNLWHPCVVVLDEGHVFAPEAGKCEAMGSVIDLCTRGRKRGFCAWIATQRISKLHKDTAAELLNRLIGRTGLDIDMKRASDELGFVRKSQILDLRNQEPGEFFGFGPAISKSIIRLKVGPVQTSHPKSGARALLTAPPPATGKIKSLLSKLGDLPKEAEEELKTIEDFKRKIRELQTELRKKPGPEIDEKSIQRVREQGFLEGVKEAHTEIQRVSHALKTLNKDIGVAKKTLEQISSLAARGAESLPTPLNIHTVASVSPPRPVARPSPLPPPRRPDVVSSPPSPSSGDPGVEPLRAGAMKMLKTVVMFHPKPVTKIQVATLAGFSAGGGTFNTYLSELRRNGWIEMQGDEVQATEAGIQAAGDVEPLPTDSQTLIEMWAGKFREGAAKMLREIAARYPNPISKDELGEVTGFTVTGGTFGTYLSELRRNDLIRLEGDQVRASKELFLE